MKIVEITFQFRIKLHAEWSEHYKGVYVSLHYYYHF
jgi:hypothetical protein